ncbi:divalent-cation tolerance protein CutA [Planctomycetaceae bacterium SH139]
MPSSADANNGSGLACVATIVLTTTADQASATRLAEQLLSDQLAACIQIDGPITSHYRWQGKLETEQEWRLMIKTTAAASDELVAAILRLHPYDEPEILCVPVSSGSPGYLNWLAEQVRS